MRITASPDIDRVTEEERPRFIKLFLLDVVQAMNNGLSPQDNFDAKTVSITFSAINTDTAVAHGLGRVPTGYFVVGKTTSMIVYNGSSANTAQLLYLRASATGTANVLVF